MMKEKTEILLSRSFRRRYLKTALSKKKEMKQKTEKTINRWRLTNFHLGPALHPKGFRVFSVSFQVFRPRRRGSPGCRRRTKTSAWWMPFILSWRVIEPYFRGGIGPCLRLWMLISPKSFCYCLFDRKRPLPTWKTSEFKLIRLNHRFMRQHRERNRP